MSKRTVMVLVVAALAAAAVVWAQDQELDDQAKRETAVRASLEAFWSASVRGDAKALRSAVGLPLTLLEQQDPAQPSRPPFVVLESEWHGFAAGLPAVPYLERDVTVEFRNLRLEWLDPLTCLASYDLVGQTPDDELAGHFASVSRYLDGWRVVVSSIPG